MDKSGQTRSKMETRLDKSEQNWTEVDTIGQTWRHNETKVEENQTKVNTIGQKKKMQQKHMVDSLYADLFVDN